MMASSYVHRVHVVIVAVEMLSWSPSYVTHPFLVPARPFSLLVLLLMMMVMLSMLLLLLMLLMMLLLLLLLLPQRLCIMVVCRGKGQGYLQEHRHHCLQPWRQCVSSHQPLTAVAHQGGMGRSSRAPPPPGQDADRSNLTETLSRITECDDYGMARKQCSTNTSLFLHYSPHCSVMFLDPWS